MKVTAIKALGGVVLTFSRSELEMRVVNNMIGAEKRETDKRYRQVISVAVILP